MLSQIPMGLLTSVSPTPDVTGCQPIPNNPNAFNCNFDSQIASFLHVAVIGTIALLLVALALAAYQAKTGRPMLPAFIERRLPRSPATPRDRRLQGVSFAILMTGLIVEMAILSLSEPGLPGQAAGPLYSQTVPVGLLAPIAMLAGLLAAMILQFRIQFRDRKSGLVLTDLERWRNFMNPRRAWRFTADGLYWWDGARWLSTLSPDGAYRWNGAFWNPVQGGPAEHLGPVRLLPTPRVPTPLTRWMRHLVAAWWALQAAVVASMPFWYIRTMTQWADAMNRQNPQSNPWGPPPDLSSTSTEMMIVFYLSLLVAFAIASTAAIGSFKGWTWAFYAIVILLGLEVFNLSSGLAVNLALAVAFGQSMSQRDWMTWADLGVVLPSAALFAWMLIVWRRTGPWAMRRLTAAPG